MIYFDNAATTLVKPECVIKADEYALKNLCANSGRGSHSASIKAAEIIYRARNAVKKLTNCDEVIFGFNCTDALNTVIFGTARRGHVITTAYEHNSVLRPLRELERRGLIRFTVITPDQSGSINARDVESAIRPDTYLIAVNHISNVTGQVAPVTQIGNIAKRHGLLYLVDGAQSVGYVDTDMRIMGCDYLCFSPHKGLHGPQGLGCLCLRAGAPLTPAVRFGGTGTASHTVDQPDDIPEGFESGTMPVHSAFSLIAAITHYNSMPLGTKRALAALGESLREELSKIPRVRLYGNYNILPNIVCFNIDGMNASAVGDILNEQYDIAVRCGLHCAPLCHKYLGTIKTGAVRASLSYHNTADETAFFVKAIKEIVGHAR